MRPSDPGDTRAERLSAAPPKLEDVYRQLFLPLVWRAVWKHGVSKEDAQDIVQEAFILALRRLRMDGRPKAWLIHVVDNLSRNHVRKVLRRSQLAERWGLGPGRQPRRRSVEEVS